MLQGHLLGLFAIGTPPARIVKAPFIIPEDPAPAIARPTINILEEFATPQSKDPSSKMPKKVTNVHCIQTINNAIEKDIGDL